MSFTNLTPDVNPDGSRFPGGSAFGIRYFYFTFIPTTASIDVFFTRNIYNNEESITKVFTRESAASLLSSNNVSSVKFPCVFINGQISINKPSGLKYTNTTTVADFKLNNLTAGKTYILESRTIYNDPGMDFGAYVPGLILKYIQSSTVPIMPTLPVPLPVPTPPVPVPPIGGLPPIPTGLGASSGIMGVSLTWNPTVQTTQYLIYRESLLISSSLSPNYMDSQVISGNPYTYTVSAVNLVGESAQSVARTITPTFLFTCVTPDRMPTGGAISTSNIRYYYYLFTPITPSIDVFCYNGASSTKKAIIGIYDTNDISTNYFKNLTNLNLNVKFGSLTLGSLIVNGLTVTESTNSTTPNFTINLPVTDLKTPAAVIKTYILEIVSYTPDTFTADFGLRFKSTALNYNSVAIIPEVPSPYVITYDFSGTTVSNYTEYIYPNIAVFQNVKNVLESIITTSPTIRGINRTNDMFVRFTIDTLEGNILGQSSLDKWLVDASRTPDFTYEQSITFNSVFFTNGYMTGQANFNGSTTVNNYPNINLFNILLHEMFHGIGFFYMNSYNTTSANVGWNSFLTDLSNNAPWYKGPINSSALGAYKTYCKSSALQRIPVEGNYGPGTALSHWDDGSAPNIPVNYRYFGGTYHPSLKNEIMTGFLGNNEYMTGLTAGFLKDYGYTVNLVCPYVVAHPPVSLTVVAQNFRVKCNCSSHNSKIIHKILFESVSSESPSLFDYLKQTGYYTPVYYC